MVFPSKQTDQVTVQVTVQVTEQVTEQVTVQVKKAAPLSGLQQFTTRSRQFVIGVPYPTPLSDKTRHPRGINLLDE